MATPTDIIGNVANGGVSAIGGWFFWVLFIIGIIAFLGIIYWLWNMFDGM